MLKAFVISVLCALAFIGGFLYSIEGGLSLDAIRATFSGSVIMIAVIVGLVISAALDIDAPVPVNTLVRHEFDETTD